MPSFEVIILGGLGGPSESSTQCFMIRPAGSDSIKSICIDGGSGVSHIMDTLIESNEDIEVDPLGVNDDFHNYFKDIDNYYDKNINNWPLRRSKRIKLNRREKNSPPKGTSIDCDSPNIKRGFSKKLIGTLGNKPSVLQKAYTLYQGIQSYYVTHPHLDHINGMILNSPLIFEKDIRSHKTIYGLDFTTDALKTFVFNDIIWPNLSHETNSNLSIVTLKDSTCYPVEAFPDWVISSFKLCHGTKVIDGRRVYSSVYLLTNKKTKTTVIFFGDTDYNQLPDENQQGNDLLDIFWGYLATNVPLSQLRGIFIECSSSCEAHDEQLYGHLSSKHLIDNLKRLYDMYEDKSDKFDLNVIITHVKMIPSKIDPRVTILNELRTLIRDIPELNGVKFYLALNKHRFIL